MTDDRNIEDLDEHELIVIVPPMQSNDPTIQIGISAHGGGTIGRAYAHNGWDYVVMVADEAVIEGSDLRSGAAEATHRQMVFTLCSFLSAAGESLQYSKKDSEYVDKYSELQQEFLISEHERLGMFAAENEEE